jgi:methyl-accepting chemotaxis protein
MSLNTDKLSNNKNSLAGVNASDFLSKSVRLLENILNDLDSISSVSEGQFIKISEKLQNCHSKIKEISGKTSEITDLLSDEQYNRNVDKLKSIFENILGFLSGSENKFKGSENSLNEIISQINIISDDVSGFKRIVKYLRIQGISTKIESSRLGGDDKGFKNLAENVDNLSIIIANKSDKFRSEISVLMGVINNVKNENYNLKEKQQNYSKTILNNAKISLDALIDKNEQSSRKYQVISSDFSEIQKNIGAVVTSVQFHDITRQQIQHVQSTLENLVKKIVSEKNSPQQDYSKIFIITHDICRIQHAQLQNSQEELTKATNDIIDNLKNIGSRIYSITGEILDLLGKAGDHDHSFIEDIKNGFLNVTSSLNDNENLGHSFSGSIEKAVKTIESLAGFVNEISEIGSEIELISLNANIKAVHIGNEGATLAVIAEEIQKLSIDARKQTNIIVDKLFKVTELSNKLHSAATQDGNNKEKENIESISKEFDDIFNSLSFITGSAVSGLSVIQKSTEKIEQELTHTIKNITVHMEVEKRISQILKKLELIMKTCKQYAGDKFLDKPELDEIGKGYTMQKQRKIHNIITSLLNESGANEQQEIQDENNNHSEFGGNVELF